MTDTTIKVLEASVGGTDLGAISFTQGATGVKAGKQHLVDVSGNSLGVTGNPLVISDGGGPITVDGTVGATQSGNWSVRNQDGAGNNLASSTTTPAGSEQALIVRPIPSGTQTVSGTVTANLGTLNGAATAANQTNVQSAAGTPNATALTVQGNSGGVPMPVSGTVAIGAGSASIGNIGTVTALTAITNALPAGANNIGSVNIANSPTVTANAGTGTFTVGGTVNADTRVGGAAVTAANPLNVQLSQANAAIGAANPIPAQLSVGNAAATFTNPVPVQSRSADLHVTSTTALAAINTLTLPAVAGQFHYIAAIEIIAYNGAARTGAAAPVTVTTTNLNGMTELIPTAGAIGTLERVHISPDIPIRSQTVNTATTIVGPATTGILWSLKVWYYAAP